MSGTQLCSRAFRRGGEEARGAGIPAEHAASTLGTPPKAEEAEPAEAQGMGVGEPSRSGAADTRSQF